MIEITSPSKEIPMHRLMKTVLCASVFAGITAANASEIKIGLGSDPDMLDPDQSRTFVGRIVYASLCDKLFDITPELEIIPQLATEWSWSEDNLILYLQLREGVTFHDGTPFDAEAVKFNIERSLTLPESRRKSEVKSITKVVPTGTHTVEIHLAQADATILAQFADRSGMMISPTEAQKAGVNFPENPVCSGPFKFSQRVHQERIVLEKFDGYWNADAINFESVTYLPITDPSVRLANLSSGDLDLIEALAATDVAYVEKNPDLNFSQSIGLGYQGITFNVGNGENANNDMGQNAVLREAFSLAINRNIINQVVFDGLYRPANQPFKPDSPWYDANHPLIEEDSLRARELIEAEGFDRIPVEMIVTNSPINQQLVQVIQSMVKNVGFDVSLKSMEFGSLLAAQAQGDYQAVQIGWSGRIDPDGNLHQFVTCEGGMNESGFCDPRVDEYLDAARKTQNFEERKANYDAARAILAAQNPLVYLYHQAYLYGVSAKVDGFTPYPDGMIRLENVTLN